MEKARILIVEDESIIALELESSLQSLGYEVTSIVDTGEKAIEKTEADNPDIILMDIRIKGEMDGIDTSETIRSQFGTPVIYSTAYLDKERIERAKITMPFGYVLKPIQERDLKVTIEMALYVSKVDKMRRKTEETLRFEKAKTQQYLDVAGVLLIALDVNGCVTLINPRGCEILGYEQEEIIGRNWFEDFLRFENIDEIKQVFNQIIEGDLEPVEYYENPITRKDGGQRIIAWHNSILYDNSGAIIGLFSSGEDITERKQVAEALKKSEKSLSTTLSSIGDAVIATDTNGNVSLLNPVAESLTGWSQKDAFGKPLKEIFNIINEETRKPEENPVEKVIKEDRIVGLSNHTVLIVKDGREIPIDDSASPIRNEKGEITGVVLVFRDITERKQSEQALKQSEERFRTLFENIQDGFALHELVYDANQKPIDCKFLEVNSSFERLTGLKKEDIVGKRVTEALPGIKNDPVDWIGTYAKVVINNEPFNFEQFSELLNKWYACRAFKINENCFAVSFTDITDRKMAES